MGEGFSCENLVSKSNSEKIKDHINVIYKLLSHLIESSSDLPSDTRQLIRSTIQAHLAILGLNSYEDLLNLQQSFNTKQSELTTPPGYPDKENFKQRLIDLYKIRDIESNLPIITNKPLATDVVEYGQGVDWSQLEGRRGINTVDYLYDLGKIMSSEFAYTATFDPTDAIRIEDNWEIENGRHRSLTLKVLGNSYVEERAMNDWILVQNVSSPKNIQN